MNGLRVIHEEVARRCAETVAADPAWPCRKGCSDCCRNLAEPPRLTRAEWNLVEEGLRALPAAVRAEALQRARVAKRQCPFLDDAAGACLIYEQRPVACRTYGFYVERGAGLHCAIVEARPESAGAVCGNQASIEARLDRMGPRIALRNWLAEAPK